MKKYLLFLLFLAFSAMLAAQQTPRVEQLGNQKRREIYVNDIGYDSLKFTILGKNDTILREYCSKNGRIWQTAWADSAHTYDVLGHLRVVTYDKGKTEKGVVYQFLSYSYYSTGVLSRRNYTTRTDEDVTETFSEKGALLKRTVARLFAPSVNYEVETDSDGRKIAATKTDSSAYIRDTTYMVYDTAFYTNGQIFSLKIHKKADKVGVLADCYAEKYYHKNGVLFMDLLPDSLGLIPFKDNVECYYGLKNRRGDTILTPQFDQIEPFGEDLFKAKIGTKVMMLRKDGKILTKNAMNNIASVSLNIGYGSSGNSEDLSQADFSFYETLTNYPQYFSFQVGDKFGLIGRQGDIVLPPQYPSFEKQDSAAAFFQVMLPDTTHRDDDNSRAIVDRQGKFLFDKRYAELELTELPRFFLFSKTARADTNNWHHIGLVNAAGEELLEAIYSEIEIDKNQQLFWVGKGQEGYDVVGGKLLTDMHYGLFDPIRRRWIMPCVYRKDQAFQRFLVDTKTKKMGFVGIAGKIILPFIYDTITAFRFSPVCAVARNGQYQIYDGIKQTLGKDIYQHLEPASIPNSGYFWSDDYNYMNRSIDFFIAKKKNKWGIIDLDGSVIVPFIYEYAGYSSDQCAVLVKDSHADIFSYLFFPMADPDVLPKDVNYRAYNNLQSFELVGDTTRKMFVVNAKNKVLYPPQYRNIETGRGWQLLENDAQKRLLLFTETEVSQPFPFKKKLLWASDKCPIGILTDDEQTHYDVVNLKTFEKYHTIAKGGVSIDYYSGTYFVKTDPPTPEPILSKYELPNVCSDTFVIDDTHWYMFDSLGKALTTNAFRYPISFVDSIGIGAIDNKFGIWRNDGTVIAPPQYENAQFASGYTRIVAYQNIGLKNWLLLLEPKTAKTLIGTGRYDGISDFYGKYALVSLGDKIGLVDTMGREIIAPISLENDAVNLMDSLNVVNLEKIRARKDFFDHYEPQFLPISLLLNQGFMEINTSPDSLNLPNPLRNRVWHYLLETQLNNCIRHADFRAIQREQIYKTYDVYNENCNTSRPTNTLRYLFADSNYISFTLVSDSAAKSIFKNYWQTKRGWQVQQLADILNLSRDNIIKINNLMREKLKKLANQEIDCGESSSFVERTQNAFLCHSEGISFYFTSDKSDAGYGEFHYVPILLTWAELKAFRR